MITLNSFPQLKNIPILIYSNLAQEDEITRAKQLGATEFVIKANVSPTEMVNKIKQYLGDKSQNSNLPAGKAGTDDQVPKAQ